MMVVFVLLILMVFIVIGIPLFFIVGPAFLAWIMLSFHDYLIQKTGFFESLKNGFGLVKQQFWTIIGTTFIMAALVQIIQGIITLVPYFIGIFLVYTNGNPSTTTTASQTEYLSTMGVLMTVVMALSIVLSYFFNNFILVNQGIIYYSLREENENNTPKSQIDLIGTKSE
jgi:hypothetical protein